MISKTILTMVAGCGLAFQATASDFIAKKVSVFSGKGIAIQEGEVSNYEVGLTTSRADQVMEISNTYLYEGFERNFSWVATFNEAGDSFVASIDGGVVGGGSCKKVAAEFASSEAWTADLVRALKDQLILESEPVQVVFICDYKIESETSVLKQKVFELSNGALVRLGSRSFYEEGPGYAWAERLALIEQDEIQ